MSVCVSVCVLSVSRAHTVFVSNLQCVPPPLHGLAQQALIIWWQKPNK